MIDDAALWRYPTGTPQSFTVETRAAAPVSYVTVVVRNHRIVREGGTRAQPVLRREFLPPDAWEQAIDALCHALHDLGGVQLRFVGEGVDPCGIPPGDEEAIASSQSCAVIATYEGDLSEEIRSSVSR